MKFGGSYNYTGSPGIIQCHLHSGKVSNSWTRLTTLLSRSLMALAAMDLMVLASPVSRTLCQKGARLKRNEQDKWWATWIPHVFFLEQAWYQFTNDLHCFFITSMLTGKESALQPSSESVGCPSWYESLGYGSISCHQHSPISYLKGIH